MASLSIISLVHLFENNHEVIHMQLDGISQADSLLQPPFRGNCLNWVVGHILGIRGDCLKLLELPGTLSEPEQKMYGYGSEPVTSADCAGDLESMCARLDESYQKIIDCLGGLSALELERQVEIWRGKVSLLEALSFMQWHESYHSGQLELLRQLSGKNDKVF